LPHAEGEVAVRGFDEDVIVVVHEAVGVAEPVVAFIDKGKNFKECFTVGVISEDGLLVVSTGSDVIHSARVFYA
jgi:hypothetical protein